MADKIKLPYSVLVSQDFFAALKRVGGKLPVKVSYPLAKVIKAADDEAKVFTEARDLILSKPQDPVSQQKDFEELLEKEFEIPLEKKLVVELPADEKVEAMDLFYLEPFCDIRIKE